MQRSFVRKNANGSYVLGNQRFELQVTIDGNGFPRLAGLVDRLDPPLRWVSPECSRPLGPALEMGEESLLVGLPHACYQGTEVDEKSKELRLDFVAANGLHIRHVLSPSPGLPVWRSWTVLTNKGVELIGDISRFDALRLGFTVSDGEPQVAYLLGWLFGPRADAPGRPPVPYAYPSWLPRLLYGDGAPPPPPAPPGGWASPAMGLVQERLTKLPLRSGKRSTYDNYPWATVLDPLTGGGFFLGFEWSGRWRIDLEHLADDEMVTISVCTDGNVHALKPGQTLTSPAAFIGLFRGDWDDAFNACRRYVRQEVLPLLPDEPVDNGFTGPGFRAYRDVESFKADLSAPECRDALWVTTGEISAWNASGLPPGGEFSVGLGDFTVDRKRFPSGLRELCDYAHSLGKLVMTGCEFERVDIRTANQGKRPWKPEWLVQQHGHPYRSWCQHVFLLCLGVQEAAAWALENITELIRETNADWFEYDSNEWAVCDDPSHGHGQKDGEWAQIQGLYYVYKGIHERFPKLIIGNCAGGGQRGDFGLARYSTQQWSDDIQFPSSLCRKYCHGGGCLYPSSHITVGTTPYPAQGRRTDIGASVEASPPFDPAVNLEPTGPVSLERLEWRILCRMMGRINSGYVYPTNMPSPEEREVLRKAMATYRQIKPALDGDRYALAPPPPIISPTHREHGRWEVYEHLSVDEKLIAVFFYRCMAPEAEYRARLRGLKPGARYRMESHSGAMTGTATGAQLMEQGVCCSLAHRPSADILILREM